MARTPRRKCEATTKLGRRCSHPAAEGETECRNHLPQGHPKAHQRWANGTHGSHGPDPFRQAKALAVELIGPTDHLSPAEAHDLTRQAAKKVQELAADRVERVFAIWDDILEHPAEPSSVKATIGSHILDRAAGKPGQHHDISIGVADWLASPTDVTDDDDVIDAA